MKTGGALSVMLSADGTNANFNEYSTETLPANKWAHIAVVRQGNDIYGYLNGLQVDWVASGTYTGSTAYTSSIYNSTTTPSIGRVLSDASQDMNGFIDELRVIKGEAVSPRFYFGTDYGDQDGGRLPQRATTSDRFVDDERTVLLVSGQSANNHARSVSMVDESGSHTDNVHFSNTTVALYPTQDGVGKQFTISGSQHTTKESFI